MQVAVCQNSFNFVAFADREACFRSFARFQSFALVAALSLECDPFDEMFLKHRMLYRTYCHTYNIVFDFIYRHVFFDCSISCTGNEFLHRFSAADDWHSGFLYYSYYLSAMRTAIKFHFHSVILLVVM